MSSVKLTDRWVINVSRSTDLLDTCNEKSTEISSLLREIIRSQRLLVQLQGGNLQGNDWLTKNLWRELLNWHNNSLEEKDELNFQKVWPDGKPPNRIQFPSMHIPTAVPWRKLIKLAKKANKAVMNEGRTWLMKSTSKKWSKDPDKHRRRRRASSHSWQI